MDTQTGHQAALFDAPADERQAPLFGGLYMAADELADQAAAGADPLQPIRDYWNWRPPELGARARLDERRAAYIARAEQARDHRRTCDRCIPGGRLCKDGRKLDKEQKIAADVLGAMMRGEL